MKQLLIILSLVLGCLQPGYTQKPVLKFNKDGKFKIVQFTDVHYIHGNPKSAVSLERINEVLDAEKPDLVLFTGDVIYGQPAEEGMRTILNRKDAHNFTVPKRCVSVREPYSAERRKAASERAKAAGYQPPVRKSSS